jgi:hypothetical protein
VIFGILRQKPLKISHFSFGPTGLSFAVAEIQSLPLSGDFWDFSSKPSKISDFSFGPTGLSFKVARYDHFRSCAIFGILRQKPSKLDDFSFGPMDLSLVVAEIRPLPVWGNFRDFASKIIKNRPLWVLSDGSIVCCPRDMVISGLG